LQPHEVPWLPWETVGSDLFELNKENYLVLVDYYSQFIEIKKLGDLSSATTIKAIMKNIARYGIMSELVSDNGLQYDNKEFRQFGEKYGFTHSTSSQNHPLSSQNYTKK